MISDIQNITALIRGKADELGFDQIGFSKAERLDNEEDKLRQWLDAGFHGEMTYMENHFEKRLDPRELMPGAKSIISLLYNYYPEKELKGDSYKIAKYAYGKDYHKIIKKRLKPLGQYLEEQLPDCKYRVFVDSAPVMERQWAAKSGLGWTGKNTLLINPKKGSYFFLAEIIIDQEFTYDQAIADHCGSCTKCLDACPTNAFSEAYVLDASKCISYATIELKDEQLPEGFDNKMEDWIFGCDICQDVCPWNRFSSSHKEQAFLPQEMFLNMTKEDWNTLSEMKFDALFEGSAVKRTKYIGLKRNIDYVNVPKKS